VVPVGILEVQDLVELAPHRVLEPAQLAHPLADLTADLGQAVRAEDEQRHHQDHEDLGRADLGHGASSSLSGPAGLAAVAISGTESVLPGLR
jgi:hypothetical protein